MTTSEFFGNLQYMEENNYDDFMKVSRGARFAYEAWQNTVKVSEYKIEVHELLEDSKTIEEFLNTLCNLNIKSFVYTCTECYAIQSVYDIIEAGCEFDGVCRVPHCNGYRGNGECAELEGIRFKIKERIAAG